MRRALALCLALAACGDTLQYVPPPVTSEARVDVAARTVMIEEVSVPEYASVQEIAVQQPDGSIVADQDNVWADLPDRALASSLLRNLNAITDADVAPAPWPLSGFPDAELSIFVEDMYAGADGRVRFSGLYAIASERGRDRLGRFDLAAPIRSPGYVGVTAAHEVVWAELALLIAQAL